MAAAKPNWGAITKRTLYEVRGLIRSESERGAEIVVSGISEVLGRGAKWKFEMTVPGGISARSSYRYASDVEARDAAERVALALLAATESTVTS